MAQPARHHQHPGPRSDMPMSTGPHPQEHALPVKAEPPTDTVPGEYQPVTKDVGTPEQADLLQVMQDVTGRFITNSISQLKRRAATLCIQELQEYKRSKVLNILGMPRGHCKQPSRPTSASYLVPAATHEKASKMIPTTTQAQPTSPHAAEHLSEKQHQHCTDVKNPPSTHEIQHTEDICTAVEPARNESIAATTEAIPKAKADRDPLPANKAAPMCAATAAITVAASDAQCSQAASTQPAQMLPLPSKRQWVPAPNLTPLPAWPEGPPQHAKGSATPWTASQSEFGMSQASLGFNPALSFGKQPCAVMW